MFNLDIFDYCFKGVPSGSGRYIMATLKNALIDNGVVVIHNFDSISYYGLLKGFKNYQTFNDNSLAQRRKVVSPEDFLKIFLDKQVDVNWFNNLYEGSIVKLGWCYRKTDGYCFDFNPEYVFKNFHKEVTIDRILTISGFSYKSYPKWYNNDNRCYHIAEFDHYLPSSVFIPQFEPLKPIKELSLSEISLDFLKTGI